MKLLNYSIVTRVPEEPDPPPSPPAGGEND